MNITLKNLHELGQSMFVGLHKQAAQTASDIRHQRDDVPGSYGRRIYAGHSTYILDFRTHGSYGRGIYAGHSTTDLDFGAAGSFAGAA
jgi:hypothetical protein